MSALALVPFLGNAPLRRVCYSRQSEGALMKIQITYDRPAQLNTDLLVVILNAQMTFHDLNGSPIDEMVRRVGRDFQDKRLKTDYFTALDSRGPRHLAVYSTALSPSYNVWENVKIFVAR